MFHRKSRAPTSRRENNTGDVLGRWMIYAAWALLLVLLTLLFSGWLEHQHNPNRYLSLNASDDENTPLTLYRNRMGHYVMPGKINGIPVVFLLDTGATHIAIPEGLAQKIGLTRGIAMQSMTANGMTRSWLTSLDSVQLGLWRFTNIKGTIMPSMPGEEVLLGMSLLKYLELTQKGDRMILQLPTTGS